MQHEEVSLVSTPTNQSFRLTPLSQLAARSMIGKDGSESDGFVDYNVKFTITFATIFSTAKFFFNPDFF